MLDHDLSPPHPAGHASAVPPDGGRGRGGRRLIYRLGHQIDQFLVEDYFRILYAREFNEALERIDSSFQFALAGQEKQAVEQYQAKWKSYAASLEDERKIVTLPEEVELVDQLAKLGSSIASRATPSTPTRSRIANRSTSTGRPEGPFANFPRNQGRVRQARQSQSEEGEAADAAARSLAHFSLSGLRRRPGLRTGAGGAPGRRHDPHHRRPDRRGDRIGRGHWGGRPRSTRAHHLQRRTRAIGGRLQPHGPATARFSPIAQGAVDSRQQTSQATIDSFPDPVLVVDPQRHVEMANPAGPPPVGRAPRENGKSPPVAWEPPDALRQPLAEVLENQREYLPEGFDKAVVLQMGEQTHFFLPRILPIRDSTGATLGRRCCWKTSPAFACLDEVKSNLVATVSHELKTPLTSIRLVLHLLLQEDVGPLAPKQLDLLVDARDNSERLLVMINNLLDLARLEQGRAQLQVRSELPSALLRTAAESFRPRAEDRGVELVLEDAGQLEAVSVDADQFQHALQNLLDNALVHTPQGGRITLSAERRRRQDRLRGDRHRRGNPARIHPFDFREVFSRARRYRARRQRPGAGDRPRNRDRPRRHGLVRKPTRREDRIPHDLPAGGAVEQGKRVKRVGKQEDRHLLFRTNSCPLTNTNPSPNSFSTSSAGSSAGG